MSWLISLFETRPYETVKLLPGGVEEVTIHDREYISPLTQKVCKIALAVFFGLGTAQLFFGMFPFAFLGCLVFAPFALWPDPTTTLCRGGGLEENRALKQIEADLHIEVPSSV